MPVGVTTQRLPAGETPSDACATQEPKVASPSSRFSAWQVFSQTTPAGVPDAASANPLVAISPIPKSSHYPTKADVPAPPPRLRTCPPPTQDKPPRAAAISRLRPPFSQYNADAQKRLTYARQRRRQRRIAGLPNQKKLDKRGCRKGLGKTIFRRIRATKNQPRAAQLTRLPERRKAAHASA